MNQGTSGAGGGHVDLAVTRCAAVHGDDGSRCDGPVDAVRVVDAAGSEVPGCVRHGAVLLASLDGGRVYRGSVDGAAIALQSRRHRRVMPARVRVDGAAVAPQSRGTA